MSGDGSGVPPDVIRLRAGGNEDDEDDDLFDLAAPREPAQLRRDPSRDDGQGLGAAIDDLFEAAEDADQARAEAEQRRRRELEQQEREAAERQRREAQEARQRAEVERRQREAAEGARRQAARERQARERGQRAAEPPAAEAASDAPASLRGPNRPSPVLIIGGVAIAMVILGGLVTGIGWWRLSAGPATAPVVDVAPADGVSQTPAPTSGQAPERPAWATDFSGDEAVFDLSGARFHLRWIPPGTAAVGSPPSETGRRPDEFQRQVPIRGFWIGREEVSQALYQAVMGANPSQDPAPEHPVESVSWDQAVAFCARLEAAGLVGARLPREAEWEYACRAGTSGPFAGEPPVVGRIGRSRQSGHGPVGSGAPNAWGLRDCHGNVHEWVSDIDATQADVRLFRGGAWFSPPADARSARRYRRRAGQPFHAIGFRIAVSP